MKINIPRACAAALCLLIMLWAFCAPPPTPDARDYAAIDATQRANWRAFANRNWPTPAPRMAPTPKPEIKTTMASITAARGTTVTFDLEYVYTIQSSIVDTPDGPSSEGGADNSTSTFTATPASPGDSDVNPLGASVSATTTIPANASGIFVVGYNVRANYDSARSHYFEKQINVVCILAKLDIVKNGDTGVYTATASYEGTAVAPVNYAWTLPPDAANITGTGNQRQFTMPVNVSGDVSVTITDSDTPTPCTDTAALNTSAAQVFSAADVQLGGYAPAITEAPASDTATHKAFTFTEPYVSAPNNPPTNDVPCAGINLAYWNPTFNCTNFLEKRRVYGATNYSGASFEQERVYTEVGGSNPSSFNVYLPFYSTETRWEFAASGFYSGKVEGDPTQTARNPFRSFDPDNPDYDTYSNSAFIIVPATTGAPVDPTTPPIEPPPPTGNCTIDCSFTVNDLGSDLYRVEAAPTGATGPVAASWKRDGVALATTALFVEATIAENASALFQCSLTDSNCTIVRSVTVTNDDTRIVIEPPTNPALAAPAAPTVARDCEAGTFIVTPPAFPTNAVSLELQRDDGIATLHTFADATAWADAGTLAFTAYQYRLRSVDANGARSEWGAYSAAISRVSDALTITWLAPDVDAVLSRDAVLRFQLADTGETLNDCLLPQLPLGACASLDVNDAQIALTLGGFALDIAARLVSGTPRNGIYHAVFDARDYSDGARTLTAKARGSDCCFASASRAVSVLNTLTSGGFYQEIRNQVRQGEVAPRARVGLETRALNVNPSRNYWMEVGARSGTMLDGDYSDAAWVAHQKIVLEAGESQTAQGERVERHNYGATIKFFLPHAREIRARQKWKPQFALACLDAGAPVAKIRQIEAGKHLVWTGGEARALIYDGTSLTPLFEGSVHAAALALDGALSGDKLYVAGAGGELFAFDTDAGDVAMNYSVRGETRAPRWVERVGDLAIALYVDAGTTRAYNLAFGAPRLLWELDKAVTLTAVSGTRLLLGAGTTLYASVDGATAPVLIHNFAVTLTSLGEKFVGFGNGDVRVKNGESWDLTLSRAGAVNGIVEWRGGTAGEVPEVAASATLGGTGAWLSSQKASGAWFDERELGVPIDLQPRLVGDVTAMEPYRTEEPLMVAGVSETTADERLLIGTSTGLLFVYGRSLLRPKPGVIAVSRDTALRLWGFGRRV